MTLAERDKVGMDAGAMEESTLVQATRPTGEKMEEIGWLADGSSTLQISITQRHYFWSN